MAQVKGKVYLVGAGPGDAELLTLKAARLLKEADVIVYDRLVNPKIIRGCSPQAQLVYVGKASNKHTLPQGKINALLARLAQKGNTVVRLKGGDPFVFGRGSEEILYLVSRRIPFEVVPGITSAIAVPSYAGIPVTHRGFTSSLGIFTGQEDPNKKDSSIAWDKISTGLGTLVFLMGVENLANIVAALIKHGRPKSTPCCLVQWGTLSRQKSVGGTLADIQKKSRASGVTPPAILVVGKVASLSGKLNWFEKKPLFGKKALVTLPSEDNSRLCEMLESEAAECVALPLINIQRLDDYGELDSVIGDIDGFHWLVFTSQNGVKFFKSRLDALNKDVRVLAGIKVAAIGPKTREAVEALGIRVDIQPDDFRQEGLLKAFKKEKIKSKNILIIRAQEARDLLPRGLEKMGAGVRVIAAYRARLREEKVNIPGFLAGFDLVTFTSSSCVEGFFKAFSKKQIFSPRNNFKIASIGPVTSQTCRKYGLKPAIEAKEFTLAGLNQAIVKYYHKKSS
jgi:uroporphyrinogen III methyltransferase / synthase